VEEVHKRLDGVYEQTDLGNREQGFDELVYIVLSNRTSEDSHRSTFKRVRQKFESWEDLLRVSEGKLCCMLQESGLGSKKAKTLKAAAQYVEQEFGSVSLVPLREMDTEEAEQFLLGIHGVGLKTAKCILMYAFGREVFPVDTHCKRVAGRLGWITYTSVRLTDQVAESIEQQVPPSIRKSLHVRLVQHGRQTCTSRNPSCGKCCLRDICQYYGAD
jgi:endonuclease III